MGNCSFDYNVFITRVWIYLPIDLRQPDFFTARFRQSRFYFVQ